MDAKKWHFQILVLLVGHGPGEFIFCTDASTEVKPIYHRLFEMPIHLLTILTGISSLQTNSMQREVYSNMSCILRWHRIYIIRRIDVDLI